MTPSEYDAGWESRVLVVVVVDAKQVDALTMPARVCEVAVGGVWVEVQH